MRNKKQGKRKKKTGNEEYNSGVITIEVLKNE